MYLSLFFKSTIPRTANHHNTNSYYNTKTQSHPTTTTILIATIPKTQTLPIATTNPPSHNTLQKKKLPPQQHQQSPLSTTPTKPIKIYQHCQPLLPPPKKKKNKKPTKFQPQTRTQQPTATSIDKTHSKINPPMR